MDKTIGIQHSKKILGVLMVVATIKYLSFAVYYSGNFIIYRYFDELYLFFSLLVFPGYYLFMVSLTKESIHQKKYLWHLAPAIICLSFYLILESQLSEKEYVQFIINFLHAKDIYTFNVSTHTDNLVILFLTSRVIYLAQIFVYIILGLRLSKSWKKRLINVMSETVGRDIRLVESLSGVGIALAFIALNMDAFGRYYLPYDSLWLILPTFFFAPFFFKIGQIGHQQDFTITDLEKIENQAESIPIRNNENPSEIRKALEKLMASEKLFLTPDLRISSVCEKLHTNRTYLSQVLNDELKENFNSFINKYRVNYAIELLKETKWSNYSLDKFSELSGFGSTISMIRAFKQIKGKTPGKFRV